MTVARKVVMDAVEEQTEAALSEFDTKESDSKKIYLAQKAKSAQILDSLHQRFIQNHTIGQEICKAERDFSRKEKFKKGLMEESSEPVKLYTPIDTDILEDYTKLEQCQKALDKIEERFKICVTDRSYMNNSLFSKSNLSKNPAFRNTLKKVQPCDSDFGHFPLKRPAIVKKPEWHKSTVMKKLQISQGSQEEETSMKRVHKDIKGYLGMRLKLVDKISRFVENKVNDIGEEIATLKITGKSKKQLNIKNASKIKITEEMINKFCDHKQREASLQKLFQYSIVDEFYNGRPSMRQIEYNPEEILYENALDKDSKIPKSERRLGHTFSLPKVALEFPKYECDPVKTRTHVHNSLKLSNEEVRNIQNTYHIPILKEEKKKPETITKNTEKNPLDPYLFSTQDQEATAEAGNDNKEENPTLASRKTSESKDTVKVSPKFKDAEENKDNNMGEENMQNSKEDAQEDDKLPLSELNIPESKNLITPKPAEAFSKPPNGGPTQRPKPDPFGNKVQAKKSSLFDTGKGSSLNKAKSSNGNFKMG
ncbi:unnamed protein product [Moneuplotes crassus]|uniref:Uncharacterized protein n=1 Tax=Euplotes crassus TaxID=5936 RepID=A0AAD1Y9Q7_EUPCR|nr:unnamed protein product [Moneuplotes crassus]